METGRPLYYPGNTLKGLRGPSEKNRKKRALTPELGDPEIKAMDVEIKTVATISCIWCNIHFEDYQIVCMRCGCCQYCGNVNYGARQCTTCGNVLPATASGPPPERRIIVA